MATNLVTTGAKVAPTSKDSFKPAVITPEEQAGLEAQIAEGKLVQWGGRSAWTQEGLKHIIEQVANKKDARFVPFAEMAPEQQEEQRATFRAMLQETWEPRKFEVLESPLARPMIVGEELKDLAGYLVLAERLPQVNDLPIEQAERVVGYLKVLWDMARDQEARIASLPQMKFFFDTCTRAGIELEVATVVGEMYRQAHRTLKGRLEREAREKEERRAAFAAWEAGLPAAIEALRRGEPAPHGYEALAAGPAVIAALGVATTAGDSPLQKGGDE